MARIDAAANDVARYAETQMAKAPNAISRIQSDAKAYASNKRPYVKSEQSCTKLDAMGTQAKAWSKQQMAKVDEAVREEAERKLRKAGVRPAVVVAPQPKTKVLRREKVCPIRLLESDHDVDTYVESIRTQLMEALAEYGSVRLD